MIKIFTLMILSLQLAHADIKYSGICGAYSYNLNIKTSKYFGGACLGNKFHVYNDASRDYIRAVYADPQVSNEIDIFSTSTGRKYASFTYKKGDIKQINDPSINFLYGLAGLMMGLSFLYPVMRS